MTGAPVVVALTGGDGAFAIAPPMRGGQERAKQRIFLTRLFELGGTDCISA